MPHRANGVTPPTPGHPTKGAATVTSTMPPDAADTCKLNGVDTPYYHGFDATLDASEIAVDLAFSASLGRCLPACNDCGGDSLVEVGETFQVVRGIAEPTATGAPRLSILPVVAADLAAAPSPSTAACEHFCDCAIAQGAPSTNCVYACEANPFGKSAACFQCIPTLSCEAVLDGFRGCAACD